MRKLRDETQARRVRLGSLRALGLFTCSVLALSACGEAAGLMKAAPASTTVKFDFDNRPLPDIPLPNDIATRPDADSATGLRVNASVIAPTRMEQKVRAKIDELDGWGLQQPISVPFTGPIDPMSIIAGHRDVDYRLDNDVIYLIDIDEDSPDFGRFYHLDVGNGNYPVVMERPDKYGPNDPRGDGIALTIEETDEDKDGNGRLSPGEYDANQNGKVDPEEDTNQNGYLDPPEDTDADGVLDRPNYLPGANPDPNNVTERTDALMTFYDQAEHTLVVAPMIPLRERTTYAVVVTNRIKDVNGEAIGSPYEYINHVAQTDALKPLTKILPANGLSMQDVAFTFPFTTQTAESNWVAVRDGLYGSGPQKHLDSDFPAELDEIFALKDASFPAWEGKNLHIVYTEDMIETIETTAAQLLGIDPNSRQFNALIDSHRYIDYHVMGSFTSPQLFDRYDKDGNWLPLDQQSWPQDLFSKTAPARGEQVYFWLVMPRKEVSARGEGKPVPVVLLGHGYGSNRVGELIGFSGLLAEFGIATLAIDNASHGLALAPMEGALLNLLFEARGLAPMAEALLKGRAFDFDLDGSIDSGVDFWTAYLFHTRDMMRQSALDYMQLIKIVRTWDGQKQWPFELGSATLGGDFDGDGIIDIGRDSEIHALGASLGGIMSTILGGAEPLVESVVPIAGGGRLVDVGGRSLQGGIPAAIVLRVMGPIYIATIDDSGRASVQTVVVEMNDEKRIDITQFDGVLPGDTMVVKNLTNGEVRCGYVLPDEDESDGVWGRSRVHIASDAGDETVIEFYRGPARVVDAEECEILDGHEPYRIIDTIDGPPPPADPENPPPPQDWYGIPIEAGTKLTSFMEGLGLRRSHPELRRFMGLGQMVLDSADPSIFARHFHDGELEFATGETVETRALMVTSVGDMNVPANSGLTAGRAAGYIDYLNPDPRYVGTPYEGMPPNQIYIESYNAEAVHSLKRFTYGGDPDAEGVHMDIANFAQGNDMWGDNLPRLDPPMRSMTNTTTSQGHSVPGFSGAVFTYASPEGQHGFALPGELTDKAVEKCVEDGGTQAECDALEGETFDVGWYMFHSFGSFITKPDVSPFGDKCNTKEQCNDIPPTPAERPESMLP